MTQCLDSWSCFVNNCTDPATYDDCKMTCDDYNFNIYYNDILYCLEYSCFDACTV